MKFLYHVNEKQLRKVEDSILNKVDGYMTISEPDYQYFEKTAPEIPGVVIPFGIDMDNYELEDDFIASDKPSLCHIGSMNWSPNIEGIEWFLDDVWPLIHEAHPDLEFTVAGHGTPDHLMQRKDANVKFVGTVPDANEFMLDHELMIVPLLSGSGIRVKIACGHHHFRGCRRIVCGEWETSFYRRYARGVSFSHQQMHPNP